MVEPRESQGGPTSAERGWNINKPVDTVEDPNELMWMKNQLEFGGQAYDPKVARLIGAMAARLNELLGN